MGHIFDFKEALAYEKFQIDAAIELLKQRKEVIDAEAENRIAKGNHIDGLVIEQGYGHSKWDQPFEMVANMGDMMGVDLRQDPKLCTPAEAKRRLKAANVNEDTIAPFYSRHPTSMKLRVEDSMAIKQSFVKS